MPTARKSDRRKAYRKSRKKAHQKKGSRSFKILLFLLLVLSVGVFLFLRLGQWDGKSKLSVVINAQESVTVATFDPKTNEITNIVIPSDTQVSVSRQKGTWKIGSVWQLGINEDLDGKLLAETVTKYFRMPLYTWADEGALGFTSNSLSQILKSVIAPYKTNLALSDRVRLAVFASGVKNPDIETIDLSQTSALERVALKDGTVGYVLSGNLPSKLLLIFSDHEMASENLRVSIIDETGEHGFSSEVGEVFQVLGAKVTAIDRRELNNIDCVVRGKASLSLERIQKIFSCDIDTNKLDGNFDLQIVIGGKFAERF